MISPRRSQFGALCLAGAVAGACASSDPPPPAVDAPSASARVEAMGAVPANPTFEQLDALVRSLESDDDLVRAAAIHTLKPIAGSDMGFDAHAPDSERAAAIERWDQWLEACREHANTSTGHSASEGQAVGASPNAP